MIINQKKNRILTLSQDPRTIFSYGLQVHELITGLDQYQFHVISSEYEYGVPFEFDGYVTWAHEGIEARTTSTLKKVIEYTNPMCIFSMGDIHHHPIGYTKPLQIPWVSWFPWDNHDERALLHAAPMIQAPNIKITMNNFSYNILTKMGYKIDGKIYNIVDTDVFYKMKKNVFRRDKLEKENPHLKGKKILLFVGRPNWRKNIEFLLSGFKKLCDRRNDVLLYLHMDFNDRGVSEKPNMEKLIHSNGLYDKILRTNKHKWTTGASREFLNHLYNLADLYVSPHGGEGFGLPFCEAMANGTQFVATDCTSMPEFAGNSERGLLVEVEKSELEKGIMRPWVNMEDFVNTMDYILSDDTKRRKMGENGIKWVQENCSKKVIIPQWAEVFDKLDIPLCGIDSKNIMLEWSEKIKEDV